MRFLTRELRLSCRLSLTLVNAPPAKAAGLELRLKAGLIDSSCRGRALLSFHQHHASLRIWRAPRRARGSASIGASGRYRLRSPDELIQLLSSDAFSACATFLSSASFYQLFALFRKKLADQTISEEQRKTVEQLLAEEEAKDCPETANDQS